MLSFFIDVLNSHLSRCHRGESGLLRPLSQKRRRLPRQPGHGCELGHRLPARRGRPRSQGGRGDRRQCRASLLQPGAAESRWHGRGSQDAPEDLRAKTGDIRENLARQHQAGFLFNFFGNWHIVQVMSAYIDCELLVPTLRSQ